MSLVPFTPKDYLTEARGRVTEAFKSKDVFDKYLQLLISQQDDLEKVFQDLLQLRSIDEAFGAQLDLIGEIVGQPRELISADLFDFFGFQGALKAGTFGDLDILTIGAKWYDLGQPSSGNVLLDDDTYKLFIKTKILKNNTASTPEEFLTFINFLFGTDISAILSEGNAEYTVLIGRELSPFEQILLNYVSTSQGYSSRLIPKTVGVRVNFGYFLSNDYFGFQGAPGAKGFGDNPFPPGESYGYGLGYGLSYGSSNSSTDLLYDGSFTYNDSHTYSGIVDESNPPATVGGGIFATLF